MVILSYNLKTLYEDLKIACIHEEGFELDYNDVKDLLDILDPIMEDE